LYEKDGRDQFLSGIQSKIDAHKRENLKKLSKGDYDEVMDPFAIQSKQKISTSHRWALKLERLATMRNIIILAVMAFVAVW
jgi:hypothetical protein